MKNNMKSFVYEKVAKRIDGFINEPELINSEYERERELSRAYRGREILELIQNAEDELIDDLPREIYISFDGKTLSVGNYGEPFSEEGVISLLYSNNSEKKYRKKKVIGNKGTGFRAILGWADSVSVNSADLHIKFSEKYSNRILKEKVADSVKLKKGQKSAVLVFPEWIDDFFENEITTMIDIVVKEDKQVIEDIIDQLNSLNSTLLLFLNRTLKLTVNILGNTVTFEKRIISDDQVELITTNSENEVFVESWLLNKKDGKIENDIVDEYYSIIIAYNLSGDMEKERLIYSYFPTDIKFPFPVLLHADLNLNGDRNHLIKNDLSNKIILEAAAELLVDTSVKVYDKVSYDRILFLIPDEELVPDLSRYGFMDMLKDKMKDSFIFPTVNNRYVRFSNDLKFYTSRLAKYLSGNDFSDLLMSSDYLDVDRILKEFGYSEYQYSSIVYKISKWVKKKKATDENIRKVAFTAIQFISEFKGNWEFKNNISSRPPFFYNTNRKLISGDKSVFLMDKDYKLTKPPRFTCVEFMDPYMRNYLYKILKDEDDKNDIEAIINNLGVYNVREYKSDELMEHINYILEKRIKSGDLRSVRNRWKTLINWLWSNRKVLFEEKTCINMYMLNRKGKFMLSNEMYYGSDYGNDLGEELLGSLFPDKMLCDLNDYIESDDKSELVEFLELFGISSLPRITTQNRSYNTGYYTDSCGEYIRSIFDDLDFPLSIEKRDVFYNLDDICKRVFKVYISRSEIDSLEEILINSKTKTILKWIQADSKLQNHLFSGHESSAMSVEIIWDKKQDPRPLYMLKKPYSFICYLFNTIPWIEVKRKRYRLSDCLLGNEQINMGLSDYIVSPVINDYIKDVEGPKGKIRKEYQRLFENLGVKSSFAELSVSKIYAVLNALPYIDNSEEMAKSFYNSIIDRADYDYKEDELKCDQYKSFIESGMILTNHGYQKIDNSFYLDGKDICDKVAQTYNLICVPKKRSKKRIKTMFGIDKLLLDGIIIGEPKIHSENAFFVNDFMKYKVKAFVLRIKRVSDIKDEARKFQNICITLCTELKALYRSQKDTESKEIELDDYEFILKGTADYYLKVPTDLTYKDMKHNMQLSSAVANIFSSYLDADDVVNPFKFLYYAGDEYEREQLLLQEVEDEGLIAKSKELMNYNEDIKEEFISIISKLSGCKRSKFKKIIDQIDFDYFTEEYNTVHIIDALKEAQINVDDYNMENPSVLIDLVPYYNKLIQQKLPLYRDSYKLSWYKKLKSASLKEKSMLVDNFLLFDDANIRVENDVYFDPDKEIVKQLDIKPSVDMIDLNALYNNNLSMWKEMLKDKDLIDGFLDDPENMSLLYYNEFDELSDRYIKFCDDMGDQDSMNNEDEIMPKEKQLRTVVKEVRPVEKNPSKKKSKNSTGFHKKGNYKESEHTGLNGERIVYETLLKNGIYKQVLWVSENAKKVGVNPEGRAGYGYDIEAVDYNGDINYIEVKTSKASSNENIRFFLSDTEYEFGRKHSNRYLIYYVSDIDSDNPELIVFEDLFINNGLNKKKFTVTISSEYTVTAQLV